MNVKNIMLKKRHLTKEHILYDYVGGDGVGTEVPTSDMRESC